MTKRENLKILWLSHRDPFHPQAGGVGRTIFEVCTRLHKMGHKVVILSGGYPGGNKCEEKNGIVIYRFGRRLGPHLALPVLLLRLNPDIVINDLGHAVPWLTPILFRVKNIVFFHHLHSRSLSGQVNPILSNFIAALEKCYFLFFRKMAVVTESTTSAEDFCNLNVRNVSLDLIPPGVNHNLFRERKKTTLPSIVYFGGLRKYKRPAETLFLLMGVIREFPQTKLHIVGTGPELVKMRNLVSSLSLQNHVIFTGRLNESDLAEIVGASWVNLHTSITEGWGFSILEAAAAGTPTVAYDVPGVRDAIEQRLNGILVKDGDRDGLLLACIEILRDPFIWSQSSREIAKKYDWDETASEWEKLIQISTEGNF